MPTTKKIAKTIVRVASFAALLAAVLVSPTLAEPTQTSEDWIPLFNGNDFQGWYTYLDGLGKDRDPDKVFQIHDKMIHVYADQPDSESAAKGYFATNAEFSHYRLRFQYRWGQKKFAPRLNVPRDAGLLYHIAGSDHVWPRSIECQIQEGDTGDCLTVQGTGLTTTVIPGSVKRGECSFTKAADGGVEQRIASAKNVRIIKDSTHEEDGWNTVEVVVRGDRDTVHIVNGHPVFEAKQLRQLDTDGKSWNPLTHGRILFQAELAEVFYRNIEICAIPDGPLHPAEKRMASLHVPPGFEITEIASPPLVDYPMLACFDDAGRLYVSEGANVNDEYHILAKTLPRSIRRLEDVDGDGVFDRSTIFADKMTFPYGGVWHDGALYVASDPSIWRLEDTDGDGVADKREELLTGFGSMGHASCMKGGFLGPDGWLYFTGGNDAGYDITDRDGTRMRDGTAPCVFRMRFDGRGLEFFANGAAGVYDLCFDPSGDLFGVVTILKYPRGDGLMHWVYGGAYQSSRGRSRYASLTGELLPPLKEWAQTSPSGAVLYESGALGDEYRGNIFTAHFNTHLVTRSIVERDGGGWRHVQDEPFVQSDDMNCRFTDALEDADGSLVVINTGGWFRIGCPSTSVGDTDLRGSIYRIRKVGQKQPADPRGLKIEWQKISDQDLVKLLDDARLVVRERAIATLAKRGERCVPALRLTLQSKSALARRNAVWALTRIDGDEARTAVREALTDTDLNNTLAALHSVGVRRDTKAFDAVVKLLKSDQPAVRREAASSLGRLNNPSAVPALLEVLANSSDRNSEHAPIFALIELDSPTETRAGLSSTNATTARGALIALDQMRHGELKEGEAAALLKSSNLVTQKAALNVFSRRGWSDGLVSLIDGWLKSPELSEEQSSLAADVLRSAARHADIQQLVARSLSSKDTPTATRVLLIDVIAKSRLRGGFPKVWREPLVECLNSNDDTTVRHAIAAMVAAKAGFSDDLDGLALDKNRPMPLRLVAAAASVELSRTSDDRVLNLLMQESASPNTEPVTKLLISRALGNARLNPDQLERLTHVVATSGPLELPTLLRAFEETKEPVAGESLCTALVSSPGAINLSAIRVQRLLERYPESVRKIAAPLIERLSKETESQAARLNELKIALEGGDPPRGHDLFYGKAACSQCHKVNKQGSGIGPDLSEIGKIRTRKDLLEAVVFPSATLARGFEPVTAIVNGRPITGILKHENAKEIFLLTADRTEVAVQRDEIEEIVPSRLSIMPQGLDRNLTPEELRDVLAYLSSLK